MSTDFSQPARIDQPAAVEISQQIDALYRRESRRVFATLIRLLGDFELAEEALHDAFAAAMDQWPQEGVPSNPRAWLVSTGRFRAIDGLRRRSRFNASLEQVAARAATQQWSPDSSDEELEDDRLRLIFTCCHPALAPEAQVALTLREVCGLTTEEIASAFLTTPATLAQRIVRGKAKIRDAGIPYQAPPPVEWAERLATVLQVIYLVFNEGYSASGGDAVLRADLSQEAIRLGRLLMELQPHPETQGLLALMLLQESRRAARASDHGELVLLEEQDRSLWDQGLIAEGRGLVESLFRAGAVGVYAVQAAIASLHAAAVTPEETDWAQIVALYDWLLSTTGSPVVELNRAVARAMHLGPAAGLAEIDAIFERGDLAEYHLAHAAHADLHRRLGNVSRAKASYEQALRLARQAPERRFLELRLRELNQISNS